MLESPKSNPFSLIMFNLYLQLFSVHVLPLIYKYTHESFSPICYCLGCCLCHLSPSSCQHILDRINQISYPQSLHVHLIHSQGWFDPALACDSDWLSVLRKLGVGDMPSTTALHDLSVVYDWVHIFLLEIPFFFLTAKKNTVWILLPFKLFLLGE